MRKLALSDEILLSVDKAARYIGGEVNSVMKNLDGIDRPCGVLFSGCLGHDFFTYYLLKSLSAICRYFLPLYLYYFVLVRVI